MYDLYVLIMILVPSAPPVDVKATALSSNSILLSWQPPPKDSWNGNLLGYKVAFM